MATAGATATPAAAAARSSGITADDVKSGVKRWAFAAVSACVAEASAVMAAASFPPS